MRRKRSKDSTKHCSTRPLYVTASRTMNWTSREECRTAIWRDNLQGIALRLSRSSSWQRRSRRYKSSTKSQQSLDHQGRGGGTRCCGRDRKSKNRHWNRLYITAPTETFGLWIRYWRFRYSRWSSKDHCELTNKSIVYAVARNLPSPSWGRIGIDCENRWNRRAEGSWKSVCKKRKRVTQSEAKARKATSKVQP